MRTVRRHQRGLSIIELMVSVAISVAVLSALSYVYVGSRGAYRTNEALARVQETGRFALEWLARDLRGAGYRGCLSRVTSIEVRTRSGAGAIPLGTPIQGFEEGNNFTNPTTLPRVRGDVVVISRLLEGPIARIFEQGAGNANIKIDGVALSQWSPPLVAGEDLLATDCERAVLFNATNIGGGGPPCVFRGQSGFGCSTIAHSATGNISPTMPSFGKDGSGFVARYGQIGYLIANNRAGRPSLYRYSPAGPNTRAEEVVENVEDLDLLYGVDTDGDGTADSYMNADAVTAAAQWDRVLSVRIALVAVSTETAATPGGQIVYLRDTDGDTVVDAQAASTDRRLRQVFTTTVALRNRLL